MNLCLKPGDLIKNKYDRVTAIYNKKDIENEETNLIGSIYSPAGDFFMYIDTLELKSGTKYTIFLTKNNLVVEFHYPEGLYDLSYEFERVL